MAPNFLFRFRAEENRDLSRSDGSKSFRTRREKSGRGSGTKESTTISGQRGKRRRRRRLNGWWLMVVTPIFSHLRNVTEKNQRKTRGSNPNNKIQHKIWLYARFDQSETLKSVTWPIQAFLNWNSTNHISHVTFFKLCDCSSVVPWLRRDCYWML